MKHCRERKRKVLWVFNAYDPHIDQITNAMLDLSDLDKVELIKTCLFCSRKIVMVIDRATLAETITKFPGAFSPEVKDRIGVLLQGYNKR